jgi:hypothetical protein
MEDARQDQQEKGHEEVKSKTSMFGDHMERESVKIHVMKLIEQRNYIDYQCYMLLDKLREIVDTEEGDELCTDRIETNDELMKVIAGDLPTLVKLGLF